MILNEQQFIQALLAQFYRGEGLNLITDPREKESPVTSGGRRLYDLIDEAFNLLDIEQLVEDVGLDEIREKYPEFADLIERMLGDIEKSHNLEAETIVEEVEEDIPEQELPEEDPTKNSVFSDVMARMFKNKEHKKLDRPYEESIYVPRSQEDAAGIDFEKTFEYADSSPERQKNISSHVTAGDKDENLIFEEERLHSEKLVSSDRELITGRIEEMIPEQNSPDSFQITGKTKKSGTVIEKDKKGRIPAEEEKATKSDRLEQGLEEQEHSRERFWGSKEKELEKMGPEPEYSVRSEEREQASIFPGIKGEKNPADQTLEKNAVEYMSGHESFDSSERKSDPQHSNIAWEVQPSQNEQRGSQNDTVTEELKHWEQTQYEEQERRLRKIDRKDRTKDEYSVDDYVVRKQKADFITEVANDNMPSMGQENILNKQEYETKVVRSNDEQMDPTHFQHGSEKSEPETVSQNLADKNAWINESKPEVRHSETRENEAQALDASADSDFLLKREDSLYQKSELNHGDSQFQMNLPHYEDSYEQKNLHFQKNESYQGAPLVHADSLQQEVSSYQKTALDQDSPHHEEFSGQESFHPKGDLLERKATSSRVLENRINIEDVSKVVHSEYKKEEGKSENADNSNLGILKAMAGIPAMASERIAEAFRKDADKDPLSQKFVPDSMGPGLDTELRRAAEESFEKTSETIRRDIGITGVRIGETIHADINGNPEIFTINPDNTITMNGSQIRIYDSGDDGKVFIGWKGVNVQDGKAYLNGSECEVNEDGKISYAGNIFYSSVDTSRSYVAASGSLPSSGHAKIEEQAIGSSFEKSAEAMQMDIGITGTRTRGTIHASINGKPEVFTINPNNTITMNGSQIRIYDSGDDGKVFIGWKGVNVQEGKAYIDGSECDLSSDGRITYAGNTFYSAVDTSRSYVAASVSIPFNGNVKIEEQQQAVENSFEKTAEIIRKDIGVTGVRTGGTVRVNVDGDPKIFTINSDNTITINGSRIPIYDSGNGKVFIGWRGVEVQDEKAHIGGMEYEISTDGKINYAGNILNTSIDTSHSYVAESVPKIKDVDTFTPDFTNPKKINIGLNGIREGNTVTVNIKGEEYRIIVRSDGTATLNGMRVHVYDEGGGKVFVGWKNADYKDGQVFLDNKKVTFSSGEKEISFGGIAFEHSFTKGTGNNDSNGPKISDSFHVSIAKSIDFDPVTGKDYRDFFRKENGTYAFKDFTHKYSGAKIERIVRSAGIYEILGTQGKLLKKEFSREFIQMMHDTQWSDRTVNIMVENYDKILAVNGDARVMAYYRSRLKNRWVDRALRQELSQARDNVIALNLTTNTEKLSKMLKGNQLTESQRLAIQEYLTVVYKSREQVIRKGILDPKNGSRKVELGFFYASMPVILKEYNLPSDISGLKSILKKEMELRSMAEGNLTDEQFEIAKKILLFQKAKKRHQRIQSIKRALKNKIRRAKNYVRRYLGDNYSVQGALIVLGVASTSKKIVKTILKTPKRMIKAGRIVDASIRMTKTAGAAAKATYRAGKSAAQAGMKAGAYVHKHGFKAAGKATVRGVTKASIRLRRRFTNMSFRTAKQGMRTAAKSAVKTILVTIKTVITAIGSVITAIISPVVIILLIILIIVFIIYSYISFDSGEVYYDAGDASHDQVIQQCVDVLTECHATFREQLQELYGGGSGNPVTPGGGTGNFESGSNFASGTDPFIGAPQLRQGDSVPVNRVYGINAGCWWNYEMSWRSWNPASSSNQRALVNYLNSHHTISRSKTGENYAMVDQKYFLAASTLYWGNVGDILKIEFDGSCNINGQNTNTIYIVIADIKAYEHTGYPADPLGLYGHPLGGNRDLAEFFSFDPLSDNSSINLNNKIGNPVTVTNMGSIMSGTSAGDSGSQVMKENPILEILKGYQSQLESDKANGIRWTYSNHNTAKQFGSAVSQNNRKVNCALLARWALRDAGLISNDTFFYGDSKGEIKWRNNGSKEAVESVCDIITVKGRTINELVSSGTLQAGDIIIYQDIGHTNIYAGNNKWYDAGHTYTQGSGEGAIFNSWYGNCVYGSLRASYIIRVKGQYFTNSLGGKNILADIVYLQEINQGVYHPLLNPEKNIYILNPEEITDLPDGISPTPTPTPIPAPAYEEGDTVTIEGEQYEVKDPEFANAEGTVSFYNNNQEIISMIIAMFDFDISISTDLKETIYALKDAQTSEEARSSYEEGLTSKISDDTWRLISYLETHGLDMTSYKEGGYDALMDSMIVALFNASHVVTDTTVIEYHDGMMYEVPIMDPEGGYLMDEDGEYMYETIIVPCPGHSKKSAAVTTIFFDDLFDLETWWEKKIYSKDAFKKENPNYEEKDHILKRDFQLINKPDVEKQIGGYCYGLPSYSNSSFENVEINDADIKQNMQKIYDFAISPSGLRLSRECAAGLMANIYAESKFNPQIVEAATGEGYGLMQWSFGRKTQLVAWCQSNGYSHTTLEGQLAFMKHEFDTGSGWVASVSGFRSCSTAEDAAEYFCRYNEQPGQIEQAVSDRRRYASSYWAKIQSGGPNWALQ